MNISEGEGLKQYLSHGIRLSARSLYGIVLIAPTYNTYELEKSLPSFEHFDYSRRTALPFA
jgi:hypothetical protein